MPRRNLCTKRPENTWKYFYNLLLLQLQAAILIFIIFTCGHMGIGASGTSAACIAACKALARAARQVGGTWAGARFPLPGGRGAFGLAGGWVDVGRLGVGGINIKGLWHRRARNRSGAGQQPPPWPSTPRISVLVGRSLRHSTLLSSCMSRRPAHGLMGMAASMPAQRRARLWQ